jgi:hypothetical protein
MGIYKDYSNSIYKEGAGESSFFKRSFALPGSLAYKAESKRLEPFLVGGGSVIFPENFAENGLDKFYLKLVFSKQITSGGSTKLVGYRSTSSSFNDGRFFCVDLNASGELILQIASAINSWNTLTVKSGVQSGKHTIDVSFDQKNFNFKFDDELLYSAVVDNYTNGFFSPIIGANNIYSNNWPTLYSILPGDYIDAAETKLNINGINVLGL